MHPASSSRFSRTFKVRISDNTSPLMSSSRGRIPFVVSRFAMDQSLCHPIQSTHNSRRDVKQPGNDSQFPRFPWSDDRATIQKDRGQRQSICSVDRRSELACNEDTRDISWPVLIPVSTFNEHSDFTSQIQCVERRKAGAGELLTQRRHNAL